MNNTDSPTSTATATAGSTSSKAWDGAGETHGAHTATVKGWTLKGHRIVNRAGDVVAVLAGGPDAALRWESTPADIATQTKGRAIAATWQMVEALELVYFGLTVDADSNGGQVDRAGLLGHVREALRAAGAMADDTTTTTTN